jgi:hypothetical protein
MIWRKERWSSISSMTVKGSNNSLITDAVCICIVFELLMMGGGTA